MKYYTYINAITKFVRDYDDTIHNANGKSSKVIGPEIQTIWNRMSTRMR